MATSLLAARTTINPLMHTLMDAMVASIRSDGPDLTARQLAVFLKIYLEPGTDHTVRGLASILAVSKPAITRALDRLEEFNLQDHRSCRFRRDTAEGRIFPYGFRENFGKGAVSSVRVGNQVFEQG
jgi:DNA-binding MarR family transcriptional regulator